MGIPSVICLKSSSPPQPGGEVRESGSVQHVAAPGAEGGVQEVRWGPSLFFFLILVEVKSDQKSCSGWKEADFVTKTVAARNARPNSPTHLNSTLNRPMASQGGTRWVLVGDVGDKLLWILMTLIT